MRAGGSMQNAGSSGRCRRSAEVLRAAESAARQDDRLREQGISRGSRQAL